MSARPFSNHFTHLSGLILIRKNVSSNASDALHTFIWSYQEHIAVTTATLQQLLYTSLGSYTYQEHILIIRSLTYLLGYMLIRNIFLSYLRFKKYLSIRFIYLSIRSSYICIISLYTSFIIFIYV